MHKNGARLIIKRRELCLQGSSRFWSGFDLRGEFVFEKIRWQIQSGVVVEERRNGDAERVVGSEISGEFHWRQWHNKSGRGRVGSHEFARQSVVAAQGQMKLLYLDRCSKINETDVFFTFKQFYGKKSIFLLGIIRGYPAHLNIRYHFCERDEGWPRDLLIISERLK